MQFDAWSWRALKRVGVAGAMVLTASVYAQATTSVSAPVTPVADADKSGSPIPHIAIDSVERADEVIRDMTRQRAGVAAQYAKDQQECSSVFFMTRCLDAARERRRAGLAQLREPEIEANAFKRRARVVERDQALEVKRLKSDQDAASDQHGMTIRDPRQQGSKPDGAVAGAERVAKRPPEMRPERISANKQTKQTAPLTAPVSPAKQASNMISFDKKAAESSERQRVIAEKKAEKERDRAAKKARAAVQQTAPVTH